MKKGQISKRKRKKYIEEKIINFFFEQVKRPRSLFEAVDF
jgi:hypothetical protein